MEIVKDRNILHIPINPTPKGAYITDVYEIMMKELAFQSNAAAIAANQLVMKLPVVLPRAFVMKLDTLTNIFIVNPMITKEVGEATAIEGCLSLPGVKCNVKRPKKIVVRGFNENWQPVGYKLHDFSARVACHEIDHLDGKLIDDVGVRV
jgi:peptide deformylase